MRLHCQLPTLLFGAAVLLAGCAGKELRDEQLASIQVAPVVVNGVPALLHQPDVSAVATLAGAERQLPPRSPAGVARPLTAEEAQCLAAENSTLANLIDQEREAAAVTAGHKAAAQRASAIHRKLLCLRAIQERNQAAGQGLEAFYRLAEAQAGLPLLDQSLEQIARTQEDLRLLKEEGIKTTADASSLDRKRLELVDQKTALDLGQVELNEQLGQLFGEGAGGAKHFSPHADLKVTAEPIDIDAAVALGLETRADLIALRVMLSELDVATLPTARGGLSQTDRSLGTATSASRPLTSILHRDTSGDEVAIRRQQLVTLLLSRESAVAAEIRVAVQTIETRLKQIALVNEMLVSWQGRLADLKGLREIGTATPLDVRQAELEILGAQSAVLKQVIAWRIAQVKLKQAQGLLAKECGHATAPCLVDECCE